jgi:hypothetical protein
MDLARSKGDRQPDGQVAHNQKLLNTFGADIEILATGGMPRIYLEARARRAWRQDRR